MQHLHLHTCAVTSGMCWQTSTGCVPTNTTLHSSWAGTVTTVVQAGGFTTCGAVGLLPQPKVKSAKVKVVVRGRGRCMGDRIYSNGFI